MNTTSLSPSPQPHNDAIAPPPCFYFRWCARPAAIEKSGRSVCANCAAHLRGQEYPLRAPGRAALYPNNRAAAEAMEMRDDAMESRSRTHAERALFGRIREVPTHPRSAESE